MQPHSRFTVEVFRRSIIITVNRSTKCLHHLECMKPYAWGGKKTTRKPACNFFASPAGFVPWKKMVQKSQLNDLGFFDRTKLISKPIPLDRSGTLLRWKPSISTVYLGLGVWVLKSGRKGARNKSKLAWKRHGEITIVIPMKLFVTLWNVNGMSYCLIHWRWESDWWGFSGCNQMRRDSFKHAWNINPVISTPAGCWMTWDLATLQSLQPGSKSPSFVNFQAFKMWKTGTIEPVF